MISQLVIKTVLLLHKPKHATNTPFTNPFHSANRSPKWRISSDSPFINLFKSRDYRSEYQGDTNPIKVAVHS